MGPGADARSVRTLDMHDIRRNSVQRAPWGRKRYYAPLPVLSVLLLTTVLAAPDILRTDFLLYEDSGLTIVARVQQVVHLSGPDGHLIGIMTVTNHHTFGIEVLALGASLASITGSPITLSVEVPAGRIPLTVGPGSTVVVQFDGPFSGDLATLATGQAFLVTPNLSWFEVYSTGVVGPFAYTTAKTCTIPSVITVSPVGGQWLTVCT